MLRHWRKLRPYLPTVLMVAGLLLLIYVGVQYATMMTAQRRLARTWDQQQTQQAGSRAADGASDAAASDGLIRLAIPKIELDAVVVEGTSDRQLLKGPGRIRSTALPGEAGNSVITAHRDTFFRKLDALRPGDEVLVRRNGEVFRFEVTGRKVVFPDEVSVLRPTRHAQLTLITCYPVYYIGPAPERLVIFSRLVDRTPDTGFAAVSPRRAD